MVGVAFSFAGVFFAVKSLVRPRFIYFSAACFVAALFSKQTMIAAPSATFVVFSLVRPAIAARGVIAAISMSIVLLAAFTWYTDGEFPKHVFLYNISNINKLG
jgi:hypothetical protein